MTAVLLAACVLHSIFTVRLGGSGSESPSEMLQAPDGGTSWSARPQAGEQEGVGVALP